MERRCCFWYSRHYMQMQFLFGLPPLSGQEKKCFRSFCRCTSVLSTVPMQPFIFGTQVENTDLFPQQAELADQWNVSLCLPARRVFRLS